MLLKYCLKNALILLDVAQSYVTVARMLLDVARYYATVAKCC